MPIRNPTKTIERLVTAIQDFHDGAGLKQAQINVSGGIDSSVMVGLLATALSPKNVIAAYVGINSSCSSRKRAQTVCEHFGVKLSLFNEHFHFFGDEVFYFPSFGFFCVRVPNTQGVEVLICCDLFNALKGCWFGYARLKLGRYHAGAFRN